MRNKWITGIILWVLLALVQATGLVVVLPTDDLLNAIIMTTAGTALTVSFAIECETRRLERFKNHKNRLAARSLQQFLDSYHERRAASSTQKINEYRESFGIPPFTHEGIKFHDASGASMTEFKPNLSPSAHYVVDDKGIRSTLVRQVTQDGDEIPMFSYDPVRDDTTPPKIDDPVRDDDVIEICKHCYRQIRGVVHIEGMSRGKMRCDPEDSQAPYGLNAEATGKPCGVTCTGHP